MAKYVLIVQSKVNKSKEEIISERDRIAEKFIQEKLNVLDLYRYGIKTYSNFRKCEFPHEIVNEIECIDIADIIVFAPGWQYDWTCKVEHDIAKHSGKKIIYLC